MAHLEKHIQKTDDELVYRLLSEWKEYSGCLNEYAINFINNNFNNIKHNSDDIVVLKLNKNVGYGFDRFFQKKTSNILKLVFKDNKLITAYPDLEFGNLTTEKYDFKNKNILKVCKDTEIKAFSSEFFEKFIKLLNNNFPVRFVSGKKSQIKIFIKNYVLKICENGNLLLVNGQNQYQKPITQSILSPSEIEKMSPDHFLELAFEIDKNLNKKDIFNLNKKTNPLEIALQNIKENKKMQINR